MSSKYLFPTAGTGWENINDAPGHVGESAEESTPDGLVLLYSSVGQQSIFTSSGTIPTAATDIVLALNMYAFFYYEFGPTFGAIGVFHTNGTFYPLLGYGDAVQGWRGSGDVTVNPITGVAWTANDINNLRFGLVHNSTEMMDLDILDALVTYSVPSNVAPTMTVAVVSVVENVASVNFKATDNVAVASVVVNWGDGSGDVTYNSTTNALDFAAMLTGSGKTLTHTYGALNTYTVSATATDGATPALTGTDSKSVAVTNLAPSFDLSAVLRASDHRTVDIAIQNYSDPDGGALASWRYRPDTGADWIAGTGTTAAHTYAAHGTYALTVEVTDNEGSTATHTATVSALNVGPTCSLGAAAVDLRTVTITPTASDVDGTIADITITWGDGDTAAGCVSGEPVSHTYDAAGGTFGIVARATDDNGATADSTAVQAIIPPNTSPTCSFTVSVDPADNLTVTINANASDDADGTIAAWRFRPDTGGEWVAGVVGDALIYSYPAHGDFTCTVEVTDNEGATDSNSAIVPATNVAPTVAAVTEKVALTVAVTPTASDTDGTIAEISIDWGDASPADTCESGDTVVHVYAAAGTFVVTVTATDDDGATAAEEYSLNDPPTCSVQPLLTGGNVAKVRVRADDDVAVTGLTIDWGDGTDIEEYTDVDTIALITRVNGALFAHTYTEDGTYTATVTVSDAASDTDVDTSFIVTITVKPTAIAGIVACGHARTAYGDGFMQGDGNAGQAVTIVGNDMFAVNTDATVPTFGFLARSVADGGMPTILRSRGVYRADNFDGTVVAGDDLIISAQGLLTAAGGAPGEIVVARALSVQGTLLTYVLLI